MKTLLTWIFIVEFWFHVLAQLLLFLQRTIVCVDVRELLLQEIVVCFVPRELFLHYCKGVVVYDTMLLQV